MHEIRAEYTPGAPQSPQNIALWHVCQKLDLTALCGQILSESAETLPISSWTGKLPVANAQDGDSRCPGCAIGWAQYQQGPPPVL